ncbi:PTS sugar transporter subunit IIA [bacterium]|nr:PTS sugar transporter subunit IIA [bacterium]
MSLKTILKADCILVPIQTASKMDVIAEMVDLLVTSRQIKSSEKILAALYEREELMSTGVGGGVAIPHAKTDDIDSIVGAFGISTEGIDFDSHDKKPVKLIFLLAGPQNQPGPHLKVLSRISRLLHQPEFRERLVSLTDPVEILDAIDQEEQLCFE